MHPQKAKENKFEIIMVLCSVSVALVTNDSRSRPTYATEQWRHQKWQSCNNVCANFCCSPNDIRFVGLRIYSVLTVQVSLFPLNGVWTSHSSWTGKSSSRDSRGRRHGAWDWAVGLRRGGSLSCVCELNVLAIKTAWLGHGRTERRLVHAADTGNYYTAELCECVLIISSQQPYTVPALFVFHTIWRRFIRHQKEL